MSRVEGNSDTVTIEMENPLMLTQDTEGNIMLCPYSGAAEADSLEPLYQMSCISTEDDHLVDTSIPDMSFLDLPLWENGQSFEGAMATTTQMDEELLAVAPEVPFQILEDEELPLWENGQSFEGAMATTTQMDEELLAVAPEVPFQILEDEELPLWENGQSFEGAMATTTQMDEELLAVAPEVPFQILEDEELPLWENGQSFEGAMATTTQMDEELLAVAPEVPFQILEDEELPLWENGQSFEGAMATTTQMDEELLAVAPEVPFQILEDEELPLWENGQSFEGAMATTTQMDEELLAVAPEVPFQILEDEELPLWENGQSFEGAMATTTQMNEELLAVASKVPFQILEDEELPLWENGQSFEGAMATTTQMDEELLAVASKVPFQILEDEERDEIPPLEDEERDEIPPLEDEERDEIPPLEDEERDEIPPLDDEGLAVVNQEWFTKKEDKDCLASQGHTWNKGMWSKEETDILKNNIEGYMSTHGIKDPREFIFGKRKGKRDDFFKAIAWGLKRPLFSIYRRMVRMYDDNNHVGKYTHAEIEKLKKLQTEHGNDWVTIGAALGRSASSVKDRCRMIMDTPKRGKWTKEEEERLSEVVHELTNTVPGESVSHGVPWPAVAKRLGNRSDKQCRSKWLNHLNWKECGGTEWTKEDEATLILKLAELDVTNENDIHWDHLAEGWSSVRSPQWLRSKWYSIKRKIANHKEAPFPVLIKQIQMLQENRKTDTELLENKSDSGVSNSNSSSIIEHAQTADLGLENHSSMCPVSMVALQIPDQTLQVSVPDSPAPTIDILALAFNSAMQETLEFLPPFP